MIYRPDNIDCGVGFLVLSIKPVRFSSIGGTPHMSDLSDMHEHDDSALLPSGVLEDKLENPVLPFKTGGFQVIHP